MEKLKQAMIDKPYMRWLILILVGFVLSVNYYFYDAFSTLKDDLLEQFNFSNTDYGLFISFYSIPNTFLAMAVIGGIILDRYGIRRTGFTFVFFMAFGAFLTAYGASQYYQNDGFGHAWMSSFLPGYTPELKMMLLGRFFFGLGAETSIVVVSKILVKWFKGKDLALAFGLKVGFGRLGTVAALNLSPILCDNGTNFNLAIWVAAILVCMGLLAFLVYILLDLKSDKEIEPVAVEVKKDRFKFSDLSGLFANKSYIYIALLCVTFYSAVFPFLAYAPDFLKDQFGFSKIQSGQVSSILPLATTFFTPLFGWLIDRKGRAATLMIYGSITLVLVHLTFAFTNISPYIPLILLGVSFSLVPAALWPTMVKLVDEKLIGTAYGLTYSIQNLGLWGIPLLAGIILDWSNPGTPVTLNYQPAIVMFAGLGIIGLIFSLLLKREDKKGGFGIDKPMNR